MAKSDILKEIVLKKKERILAAKNILPEEAIKEKLAGLPAARDFLSAVSRPKAISLIAEIKKQSPSAGVLVENFDPVAIANVYKQAGANAISVLTEEDFFGGSLAFINNIKASVDLPILRKDFILESYQVYESRLNGADAILLIADLLTRDELSGMIALADSLGMVSLVEIHTDKELKKVLNLKVDRIAGPDPVDAKKAAKAKSPKEVPFLLGINNRDLHTLEVDLKTTEKLITLVPKERTVVVESGIKNYQDVLFLKILGVSAVLVGESILKSQDKAMFIQDLMGL